MQMGQSTVSRRHDARAIFNFTLSEPSSKEENDATEENAESKLFSTDDHFAVEFTHEQLYEFFLKLEHLQGQLDTLS